MGLAVGFRCFLQNFLTGAQAACNLHGAICAGRLCQIKLCGGSGRAVSRPLAVFARLVYSKKMMHSLSDVFSFMEDAACAGGGDLFAGEARAAFYSQAEAEFVSLLYSGREGAGFDRQSVKNALGLTASRLFELSAGAFYAVVNAWMSEMPIEGQIASFGRRVVAAGGRSQAAAAASDRGDAAVRDVLAADYKVRHEIARLKGFLRFSLTGAGLYAAFCQPDYFTLPALAGHFNARFGDAPWAVTDEKRRLRLGGPLFKFEPAATEEVQAEGGQWEDLWVHYHKTINNVSRSNPALQHQFLPARYRKNMLEF